jgi:hypothetical protein
LGKEFFNFQILKSLPSPRKAGLREGWQMPNECQSSKFLPAAGRQNILTFGLWI